MLSAVPISCVFLFTLRLIDAVINKKTELMQALGKYATHTNAGRRKFQMFHMFS